jgi:hypothetical protein
MSQTLNARFSTRRDAELAVEHLVQEYGIERTDIFVSVEGSDNSAGESPAGAENEAGSPSVEARKDAPLDGAILVSVDINDDSQIVTVKAALRDLGDIDVGL